MYVEQLYTGCLAEAAYYIQSGHEAAVIDPLRDPTPYLKLAQERGATIRYIFETHFHTDFISGHRELAKLSGATIVFGPTARPDYTVHVAADSEFFILGDVRIKLLHTPGHTQESSCYLLIDEDGKDRVLFTGDTLLVGDVGRPELVNTEDISKEELAGLLFDSLHKKIMPLADDVVVYPAHATTSAEEKTGGEALQTTLGVQKRTNHALQTRDKAEFILLVTEELPVPPAHFPENARINRTGAPDYHQLLNSSLRPLRPQEVAEMQADGALVLDVRNAQAFAEASIPASLNIGLDGSFALWAGSLIPLNQSLIIISEAGREQEAIERLARVGFDRVQGYLKGGIRAWKKAALPVEEVPHSDSLHMIRLIHDPVAELLDVRKPSEFRNGYVQAAKNVPLAHLQAEIKSLSKDKTYLVYCASGYRSMIAVSLLRKAGFRAIQVTGGFAALRQQVGIPIEEVSTTENT